MLDKPCNTGVIPCQQTCYQPVQVCTYCPVLGSFNNCNFITFYHKVTTSEYFEEIYQVAIDVISENMAPLVKYGKYGAMKTTCSTKMV